MSISETTQKIQPIGGNILVKPEVIENTTPSGLMISTTVKGEKPQQGMVIALGTGKLTERGDKISFNVKTGDTVIFKKYSPDEIEIDGESYLIMDEADILAVVSK